MNPIRDRVWEGLDAARAGGRACVICGQDHLTERPSPIRRVRVGRARSTGSPVFACAGECLARAALRCYPGGAVAISPATLARASRVLHHATARKTTSWVGDPLGVAEVASEVVAATAPLIIAAELRWLARVFEDHAHTARPQGTDTAAPREGGDLGGQRALALLECARMTRSHAFDLDPTAGTSPGSAS